MISGLAERWMRFQEVLVLRWERGTGEEVVVEVVGPRPGWLSRLKFRPDPEAASFALLEVFPYLETVWTEVRAAWDGARSDGVSSGLWIEPAGEGEDIPLEAVAYRVEGTGYLVVRRVEDEHRVRQQVLQAARERMLEHERMVAERSAREVLLHCVVHDLAGPLAGIRGCLELLAQGGAGERTAHYIGLGLAQVRRQQSLIEELLQVFSPGAEGGEGAVSTDLMSCVAEVMAGLAPAYAVKQVELRSVVSPTPAGGWRVVAEESRLARVLFNLLENALRHAPEGTVVTVGLGSDGAFRWLTVEDQGPGVDPEVLPRLFQQFVRGGRLGGKAGLGLFFCRITVERWGGSIGCEGGPGGGARFRVRLCGSAEEGGAS